MEIGTIGPHRTFPTHSPIQPLGLAEISSRISAAVDRAKKYRKANTITIKIEVKQPSRKK